MRFANLIYKSAKIRLDKRAGELKAEILMGIFKSWNGLIISCNEKFITLKVSWPSWTELCGVLGLELRDVHRLELHGGLGFDPHFRGSFNFIYNFYYIDSVPFSKSGVLGFICINVECSFQFCILWLIVKLFYFPLIFQNAFIRLFFYFKLQFCF